jgi:hypothetical protein
VDQIDSFWAKENSRERGSPLLAMGSKVVVYRCKGKDLKPPLKMATTVGRSGSWWILKYDGDDEKDKKQGTDLRLHESDLMFNVAGHGGRKRATTK